jgi:signal transduction histidine kinase
MSGRPRVLLIEADGVEVASTLHGRGMTVEAASDLAAARTELEDRRFDCVVTAAEVPDGEGGVAAGVDILRDVWAVDRDLPTVLYGDERDEEVAGEAVSAGLADYAPLDVEGGTGRLVGRVRNAVARRQAVRRAEQQARMNEVLREISQTLVRVDSHEAIEDSVCERLAHTEQYAFAWIAGVDDDLTLRAMAVDDGAVQGRGAISIDEGTAFTEPVRRAAGEREVVVVREIGDRGGVWEAALGQSFEAVAAVPFVYDERLYGVLVLYADRPGAFAEDEQRVLADLGATIAYAMNAVDVRRKMQLRERQLRRQNERLEEFASVVSHDLRNPLTVARGYLEALGDGSAVGEIRESLDRMETIIEDVLEMARQGGTIEETTPVDLGEAARTAWGNVDTGEATLDVAAEATVDADESRFRQLLENLFRNALEHGDAGVVRVGPLREDGDLAGLYVEDDGPGIPPEEREDVLEMGYTNSEDGTGFGLAIVAKIADAHGWQPRVTEGSDGGARFEFTGVAAADTGSPG